jgi:hypothetical protein
MVNIRTAQRTMPDFFFLSLLLRLSLLSRYDTFLYGYGGWIYGLSSCVLGRNE